MNVERQVTLLPVTESKLETKDCTYASPESAEIIFSVTHSLRDGPAEINPPTCGDVEVSDVVVVVVDAWARAENLTER